MFLKEKEIKNEVFSAPRSTGRVVDLRKRLSDCANEEVAPICRKEKKLTTRIFGAREKKLDLLKHYLLLEKKDEFIDKELMVEDLDEKEETRKHSLLTRFFGGITGAAKFWWLPIFVIRPIWRLIWRMRRGDSVGEKVFYKNVRNQKVNDRRSDFFYPFKPFKHVISFLVVSLLVIIPIKVFGYYKIVDIDSFKSKMFGIGGSGLENLGSAADAASIFKLNAAAASFSSAKNDFARAGEEMSKINSLLLEAGKLVPNKKVRLASYGKDFAVAAESAASLGENLSLAANSFFPGQDKKFSEMVEDFIRYERAASADATKLNDSLSRIDSKVLPKEYSEIFDKIKEISTDLAMLIDSSCDAASKINIFLGAEKDKRYLFVFQNNSEMRASGGFIGSFALVDFSQGKIKNIEVPEGGSYDTEGGLRDFVTAPEPLWLVNPLWHFWDANWWPDWKKSAQKLSWFYEKSDGPSVDGVISFTPTVLERILKVIGPIDMTEEYGVIMDSDNLWFNLRDIIEKEKAQDLKISNEVAEKKPKRVVGDLLRKIMEEMPKRLDKDKFIQLTMVLNDSLNDKQVLFYFENEDLQKEAEKRNWAGRIKDTGKDYLSVVNTNIAGGKSDGKMEEKISHEAKVMEDGSIIDTLIIKKKHLGVDGEPYFGVRNVNWMRVYVPEGSVLLEASGFRGPDPIYFDYPSDEWGVDIDVEEENGENAEIDRKNLNTKIYKESGKTVFANWVMVDPGQEVVIKIKYKLPFKFEKKSLYSEKKTIFDEFIEKATKTKKKDLYIYSFMAQKQPGMISSSIESEFIPPAEFSTVWSYPESSGVKAGWVVDEKFDSDKYWALMLERVDSE